MLRHISDSIVLMDADGVILENSDRTGRLLGLPPEMVGPGKTHLDVLRYMYRRGDYGFDVSEETFVQQDAGDDRRLRYPHRARRRAAGAYAGTFDALATNGVATNGVATNGLATNVLAPHVLTENAVVGNALDSAGTRTATQVIAVEFAPKAQ
jgi:PAS domain-containing protein